MAGGKHAYCNSVANNIANYAKGIGLSVSWPSNIPTDYLNYNNPPPSYISQQLKLNYNAISQQHDFVAKTYRTTVWTSIYLTPPTGEVRNDISYYYVLCAHMMECLGLCLMCSYDGVGWIALIISAYTQPFQTSTYFQPGHHFSYYILIVIVI